jgi:hypothetical protein
MWINSVTDNLIKLSIKDSKDGDLIESLYKEIKRLNLVISKGKSEYTTLASMSEEEKKSVNADIFCSY